MQDIVHIRESTVGNGSERLSDYYDDIIIDENFTGESTGYRAKNILILIKDNKPYLLQLAEKEWKQWDLGVVIDSGWEPSFLRVLDFDSSVMGKIKDFTEFRYPSFDFCYSNNEWGGDFLDFEYLSKRPDGRVIIISDLVEFHEANGSTFIEDPSTWSQKDLDWLASMKEKMDENGVVVQETFNFNYSEHNFSLNSYGDYYNYLTEIDDDLITDNIKIYPLPHLVFRKSDGSVWGIGGNNFKQIKDSPKNWFDDPVQIYPFEHSANDGGGNSDEGSQDSGGSTESISELRAAITELENKIVNLASKDDLSLATDAGRRAGINEVLSNPTAHGLTHIEVLESSGATPHTNGWFFQPDWGWLWTNASVFPYVYRSEQQDTSSSWLYFKENSSPPYFFNYETEEWEVMGE